MYCSLFAIVLVHRNCDIVFGKDWTIRAVQGEHCPHMYYGHDLDSYIGREVVAFSIGGKTSDHSDPAFGKKLKAALKTGECTICFRNIIYTIINNHQNRLINIKLVTLFSGSVLMNLLSL